jgi:hypothetical protein
MIYENGAVLALIRKRSCNFAVSHTFAKMKASPFGIVIVLLTLIDESSRGVLYVNAHIKYRET